MHYTYFGTSSSDSNQSIAPPVCVIKLYDPTSTMDTIIKYDKAVGYLKTPPPSLEPRSDFNNIRALKQHVIKALYQMFAPKMQSMDALDSLWTRLRINSLEELHLPPSATQVQRRSIPSGRPQPPLK